MSEMRALALVLVMGVVGRECKVGREERVEVVVASYSGEMELLLRQAVRDGQQGRAVSLLLGEVGHTPIVVQVQLVLLSCHPYCCVRCSSYSEAPRLREVRNDLRDEPSISSALSPPGWSEMVGCD